MNAIHLTILWGELILIYGLVIWFLYVLITRKKLAKWRKVEGIYSYFSAFAKKHEKKYDITYKFLISVFLVACLIISFPLVKDIPNMVSGYYLEVSGVVAEDQTDTSGLFYTISIKREDTNEIQYYEVGNQGAKKGSFIVIRYLPNSKYGSVIQYIKDPSSE